MSAAGAILLAAGQSTRFGRDKRQATGDWQGPLLHHVLRLFRPHFPTLGVVIGPDDAFGAEACAMVGATALVNREAGEGMGRSLAVGIGWLAGLPVACAVIGLADMPYIAPRTIEQVAAQGLQSGRLVAPRFRGEWGFPRAIPVAYFAALQTLRGDRGASALLDWNDALALDIDDDGVLQDIDRPEDLPPDRRE